MLSELEAVNDRLRREAMDLSMQLLRLRTESQIIEEELLVFQALMSRTMRIHPMRPAFRGFHWQGQS
jgi:hypothetical protein